MLGQKVINTIIEGKLFTVSCPDSPESSCLIIWSANAPEQLTTLLQKNDDLIEQDYSVFRNKFDELIIPHDTSRANTLIYNTIPSWHNKKKTRLQTALILIDTLAVELNK